MRDERGKDGRGPAQPVRANILFAAFGDAPAVIAGPLHAIDHFPKLPSNVPHIKFAEPGIEREPPRIPEAVGPNLTSRVWRGDERVIPRNPVSPSRIRMVHIDPQHAGRRVRDGLSRYQFFRAVRNRGISPRNVEDAVGGGPDISPNGFRGLASEDDLRA